MSDSPNKAQAIFLAAIEQHAPEQWQAFLDEACRGDAPLRERVEQLLRAQAELGSFHEATQAASVATLGNSVRECAGTVIGPYKLLQQIGEGGMGTVWMAEQTRPVQRKVALKVIKAGMDTRQVIARFEAERQALALMDHPNIAKVFDAGTTDNGRPYFVMELVKGQSITKFCDEHRLTPRQRLELFLPVCQAIQHAHQKGIIHRDIKASNILIAPFDSKPVVKVIDFGIAKATGQQLTDKTLFTEFGAVIGTLEYMSPEQAELNNQDIDTRSDIYSLGVLLYELLTGTTPLDRTRLKKSAFAELLRIIREEEPPRPSARLSESTETLPSISAQRQTEPAKLTKLVRGELDWIVMKALDKDRNRRYETVNGFAMDLQRYLSDEPVQACPPSAVYRLRKFVRRHKGPVLAASLVVVALVAGIIGTSWGLLRAEQAWQAEFDRAEGERLAKLDAEQARKGEFTRAEGERLAKLDAERARQKEAERGEAERKANESAKARAAETKAALEFVENRIFAAARPEGQEGGQGYEVTLRKALEAALPFVETGFKDQPLIEARLRTTLGISFFHLDEHKTAAAQFEAARAIYWEHRGCEHRDTLEAMNNVGMAYANLGRRADALKLLEEALALQQAKLGPDDRDTVITMGNLAGIYSELGRHTTALKLYEKVLPLDKAKFGPDHPNTLRNMHNLAILYHDLGRYHDELKLREEALAIQKAKLGLDHSAIVDTKMGLSVCYGALGRHKEALKLCEETLVLAKAKFGPDHTLTLGSMCNLAKQYAHLGKRVEAVKLYEETLGHMKAKIPDHRFTCICMDALANSYAALGRHADALKLGQESLALHKAKLGPDHPNTLTTMGNLAITYSDLGQHAEALKLFEETLALQKVKLGFEHPRTVTTLENLAMMYYTLRRDTDALRLIDEALAHPEAKLSPQTLKVAAALRELQRRQLVSTQLEKLGKVGQAQEFKGDLTKTAPLLQGKHFKAYPLEIKTDKHYLIDVISAEFDAYVIVKNLAGKVIAEDDDGGGKTNSRLLLGPMASGQYEIVVSTFGPGQTGGYTLRIQEYQPAEEKK